MNLLSIMDSTPSGINELVELALQVKKKPEKYSAVLGGKTLGMLFERPSTRTRVSFEVTMTQLGGHAIYLDFASSQMSRGESVEDTARVLGRYVDAIMARLYNQDDLVALAKYSGVPVINGLTNDEHPCQALSDLMTMKEKGKLGKGKVFAFVGDCSLNMANSLMLACAKSGMEVRLGCPAKYMPSEKYLKEARKFSNVKVFHDANGCVDGADVIYTYSWKGAAKGEEAERVADFGPFQVNAKLLSNANDDAIVMHCLPAKRGVEITSEVLDGRQSAVWDEAENRLHMQKAIMLKLLEEV